MKKIVLSFLVLLTCGVLTGPLWAHAGLPPSELSYKKSGFFLGGELGAFVGFDDRDVEGAPGKLDLLVGYQFNPYISAAADLWTFWFIAYAAEAHVKANFIDAKISPYAVGTVGAVHVINVFDDGGKSESVLIYSSGLGVDFHLWKRTTLFAEAKYRGATGWEDGFMDHGIEMGVGLRWIF